MEQFSPEVCRELGYYVYRLVDPRNGHTFYVGKGKNNRVFAHTECALDRYSDVGYDPQAEDEGNLKYQTIREIRRAGLDVIHIIHRYGMNEHDALLAESVLIDTYALLTNKIKGVDAQEPMNVITLQKTLAAAEYQDDPAHPRYMIIKIKDYWLSQRNDDRYERTRSAWRINPRQAEKYPYVLSVTAGIVCEVYKVHEWHECGGGRSEFTGEVAEDAVRQIFLDKRIPQTYRKKGQASPCLYCKI